MTKIEELIDKLKNRPRIADEEIKAERQSWLESLDDLYKRIEAWLQRAVEANVLQISRETTPIVRDGDLGSYEAPSLHVKNGELTVRFEPRGARVVGLYPHRHTGFRGLVELVSGPIRIPIVRERGSGDWKVLPAEGEPEDFTEDSLAELLSEVLTHG